MPQRDVYHEAAKQALLSDGWLITHDPYYLALYRQILGRIIEEEAQLHPATGEIEVIPLVDAVRDQYQLLHVGWDRNGRVFSVIFHIRLRDGKVWIERHGTAEGIASRLVDAGIPREDIVLAFHPAWKRQYTGFAIARV